MQIWWIGTNKSQYLVLYLCIILPLFLMFYIQYEEFTKFNDWDTIGYYSFSFPPKRTKYKNNHCTKKDSLLSSKKEKSPGNEFESIFISKIVKLFESSTNQTIYSRVLFKIFYFLTGISLSDFNTEDSSISQSHFEESLAAKCGYHLPCKSLEDINLLNYPSHEHLYSTDEASSSEADFFGSTAKAGKRRGKKSRREGRKPKYSS